MTHAPRAADRSNRIALWSVLATAILVRALIIVSYPPIIAGLAQQMAQGALQGNLVYSTGYPFALSFALRPLQGLWAKSPDVAYRLVLVMQHACGVAAVVAARHQAA